MKQLLKLAWRSIWRNRRRTIITLSSITFGLTIAIFFIAFANGVYDKMIDDAVRMLGGHVTLEHPEYRDAPSVDLRIGGLEGVQKSLEAVPEVESIKPLILGQGVIKSGYKAVGIALIGIQPSSERDSSPMAKRIVAGTYLNDEDSSSVIIGSELAKQLKLGKTRDARRVTEMWEPYLAGYGLSPNGQLEDAARIHLAVGKKVVVSSTDVNGKLVEDLVRVRGVFKVGAVEIDGYMVQVPIGFARKLYSMEATQVTQLGVVVRNPEHKDLVLAKARQATGKQNVSVLPWDDVMPDLAAYIEMDGGSNYVFQGIILFLIMFTIFNTILMSVLERHREFAVLLALGTPPRKLKYQVLIETALIGLLGCTLGLVIGGVLTYLISLEGLDISGLYEEGMSVSGFAIDPVILPQLTTRLLAWLGGLVFGAIMLLGLYPMQKSTRVPMAQLLR